VLSILELKKFSDFSGFSFYMLYRFYKLYKNKFNKNKNKLVIYYCLDNLCNKVVKCYEKVSFNNFCLSFNKWYNIK